MSHSHEDIHKTIRSYVMVFVALLILTGVTVGVSYIHLESVGQRVALAPSALERERQDHGHHAQGLGCRRRGAEHARPRRGRGW